MKSELNFLVIKNETLFIDGIDFCDTLFIRPKINGMDIIADFYNNDCLAVADEWVNSSVRSGDYLLFTSLIGVADDGGWSLQPVVHGDGIITVSIPDANEKIIKFNFSAEKYKTAIGKMKKDVASIISLDSKKKLEPIHFSYPE